MEQICTIKDCDKPIKSRRMCSMHNSRLDRFGSLDLARERRVVGGTVELTKGMVAFIDPEDAERVREHCWYMTIHGYAAAKTGANEMIYLHRFVMSAPPDAELDHIDRNKLNNRKSNLRFCTSSQNMANRAAWKKLYSRFKGVTFDKSRNRWLVQIKVNGKKIQRRFKTERDAAIFYNDAAREAWGEFAYQNPI